LGYELELPTRGIAIIRGNRVVYDDHFTGFMDFDMFILNLQVFLLLNAFKSNVKIEYQKQRRPE